MNQRNYQSILNTAILSQIENYVIKNEGLSLKLLGFADEITVNNYGFPSSFDDDETRSQLKKLTYKSSFDLLNAAYRKLGMTELSKADIKRCIAGELAYYYLDISFSIPISPKLPDYDRTQSHNFMIFLGDPEAGDDPAENGLRILYSPQPIFNYAQEFDRAVYLDLDSDEPIEKYQSAISQLEAAIYGICKTVEIEIPPNLQSKTLDRLIILPPKLATFKSLLKLITRNRYEDSTYQQDAKKLQTFYKKRIDKFDMHCKIRDILEDDDVYYMDWKFDPEDIEYGLSTILAEEFTFEYPEETYAHHLFPYIRTELAKKELVMLNIDTGGDGYLLFIVNIADVNSILELAQSIDLIIVDLN